MQLQSMPYVAPLLLASLAGVVFAVIAYRRRQIPGAMPFFWLMVAATIWAFGYALELASVPMQARIFWAKVQYLGISIVSTAWLIMAIQYSGHSLPRRITKLQQRVLFAAEPLATVLLVWTNEFHGYLWRDVTEVSWNTYSIAVFHPGFWYWIHIGYSYLTLLTGSLLLIRGVLQSAILYRRQAAALLFMVLLPWIGNGLYVFRLTSLPYLDFTPFAFVLAGAVVIMGMLRTGLLKLSPVVRDTVIERMSDGILLLNSEGCVLDLNPETARILNMPVRQAIGQQVKALLPAFPDLNAAELNGKESTAIIDLPAPGPAPAASALGHPTRHYEVRISSMRNWADRIIGSLAVIHDVTERVWAERDLLVSRGELELRIEERTATLALEVEQRKKAAEALRESEARYRSIFEQSPLGIYRATSDGMIVAANPALLRMLGFQSIKELIQSEIRATRIAGDGNRHEPRGPIQEEDRVIGMETTWRTRSGSILHARESGRAVRGAQSELLYYEGIVEDVSEKRRAERLLKALNDAALAIGKAMTSDEIYGAVGAELRKLGFSCMVLLPDEERTHLNIGYLGLELGPLEGNLDPSVIEDRRVFLFLSNANALSKVVLEKQTVMVDDPESVSQALVAPSFPIRQELSRLLARQPFIAAPLIIEEQVLGVLTVHSEDLIGSDMPAVSVFAHQVAGALRKAQLLVDLQRSLQELENAQAQLLHAKKMEAVGMLAGGVAHDFNNILTVILGYCEMLLMEMTQDPLHRSKVEEIHRSASRAADLTRQLLAFSRKQLLQPRIVQLNDLVLGMEKLLRRLIGENVDLRTVLEPDLRMVRIDPASLEQVIMNLAVNARDAMPLGGVLTLSTENITLGNTQAERIDMKPGPCVCLMVTDTGMGISEDILPRIFEPFFTTRGVGKGTGLGLAMVHGIVKQSGGDIQVESQHGGGTTFRIYLPSIAAQEEEAEPVSSQQSVAHYGGNETILLVEDEETVRGLASRLLQRQGYRVLSAAHPKEALALCMEEAVDLLVTDVVMPGMNGPELVERIRERKPEMKVLYISGYTSDAFQRQGITDFKAPFLQKPFQATKLAVKVREALDSC